MRRPLLAGVVLVAVLPGSALAQAARPRPPQPTTQSSRPAPPRPREPRLRFTIDGGMQFSSTTTTMDFPLTINQETGNVATSLDLQHGGFVDAGLGYKVGRRVWIGVSVSFVPRTVTGDVVARIPHPFFFDQDREAAGTVDGLKNEEVAVHGTFGYAYALSRSTELLVFGGPSLFRVAQDLVTDISYDSEYPFDTATLASATTSPADGLGIGVNAGIDVSHHLTPTVSLGISAKYSRGVVSLEAIPGSTTDIDAGGLMVGGGLRVLF